MLRRAGTSGARFCAGAADLLGRPLSLIVTPGDPAALAVKAAGLRIPDVFIAGEDPVRTGLVKSMNRPGMATGVNFFTGDLGGKRMELLCSMVPSVQIAGLLVNPRFGAEAAEQHRQSVAAAAETLGRKLVVKEAATDAEIDAALKPRWPPRRPQVPLLGTPRISPWRAPSVVPLRLREPFSLPQTWPRFCGPSNRKAPTRFDPLQLPSCLSARAGE